MKNNEQISKYLSYILRHKPESIGLKLDVHGWADINDIIEKTTELELNRSIVEKVVQTSPKQRFSIRENKIRANQGHSIKVDLNLEPSTPPKTLYHGTAKRFLDSIMTRGLQSQERQHVHLSDNIETAIEVGRRHGKVSVLKIDSGHMHDNGHVFYVSDNKVWLTDYVPAKYISLHQG